MSKGNADPPGAGAHPLSLINISESRVPRAGSPQGPGEILQKLADANLKHHARAYGPGAYGKVFTPEEQDLLVELRGDMTYAKARRDLLRRLEEDLQRHLKSYVGQSNTGHLRRRIEAGIRQIVARYREQTAGILPPEDLENYQASAEAVIRRMGDPE